MKFGYTIIYVPNVAESLSFFESAFGLTSHSSRPPKRCAFCHRLNSNVGNHNEQVH